MNVFLINSGCTESQMALIMTSVQKDYNEVKLEIVDEKYDFTDVDVFSLLLVCFVNGELSSNTLSVITKFRTFFGDKSIVIPVAFGIDQFIDAPEISLLKSQSTTEEKWLINLTNRIGTYLGLNCLPKDYQVFISYRATDGKEVSNSLSSYLKKLGFKVWRDEDRDEDNEGNLKVGLDVEKEIQKALLNSNIVLLIDTPDAPNSKYVNDEIDFAHANLIPVLPLCFRHDNNRGSNFRKLRTLNRYCGSNFQLDNLEEISRELFKLLAEVYKRKRKIPFEVAQKFQSAGYNWASLDDTKLLFESSKRKKFSSLHELLSHCPIYDGVHDTFIHNFIQLCSGLKKNYNHRVFVYDGAIYMPHQIEEIIYGNPAFLDAGVDVIHHEQIEEFLSQ